MIYTLPSLQYKYDELEPYFDKKTMEIHYTKHHQTYVNNANIVLKIYPELAQYNIEKLMENFDKIPANYYTFMRNNAGAHFNHSLFWKCLKTKTILSNDLKAAILHDFGSISQFQEEFEKVAMSQFGSGWVWLILKNNKLNIISTSNQDNPLMKTISNTILGFPILCLDVWEHAYYLKYQYKRLNYIKAFWNVVNWDEASIRFKTKT
ncbi:Superoxide dismutase [Mn] [Candidatus Ecksteinia adelgidicola]|nr:Superoxide dismutase [Mn] [Candidatus Ecksteinia adelgidicola]